MRFKGTLGSLALAFSSLAGVAEAQYPDGGWTVGGSILGGGYSVRGTTAYSGLGGYRSGPQSAEGGTGRGRSAAFASHSNQSTASAVTYAPPVRYYVPAGYENIAADYVFNLGGNRYRTCGDGTMIRYLGR